MKNILQISYRIPENRNILHFPEEETVTLSSGHMLFFYPAFSLLGDVRDELWEELWGARDQFKEDLEKMFVDTKETKVLWGNLAYLPQEMLILFEETYETDQTEAGPEGYYYAEYIGILNLDTLNETNCYERG